MKNLFIISTLAALLMSSMVFAQDKEASRDLIQLSGVVVSGDSLSPVSFTSVLIKGSNRGTMCDYYGFFSLVVKKKDTVMFRTIGYTTADLVISDTLTDNRYSIIQLLNRDTVTLKEQVVYPWPSREQFRDAFLALNPPVDDYDRAFQNLTREDVRLAIQGVPASAMQASSYNIQREYTRLYQMGQLPQLSLLNPLAWAQFIEAWKKGDFKSKQ